MSDEQLLTSIANGNRQAFGELYMRYNDIVYNTALGYAKQVQEAEEITQDVFIKINSKAGTFKGSSAVGTWIYRITVNTALNHIKKKKRFSFLKFGEEAKEQPDFEHPGVIMENKESAKMLFSIIDGLSDLQKTAFILSYVENLPRKEVANIMETSLKSVEALLMRAKKKLREKLTNKKISEG